MDYKDSQAFQDVKNAKKFMYICIAVFVIGFPLIYHLSDTPLAVLKAFPIGWALYVIIPILTGILIWGDFKDKAFATETGGWYYLDIALLVAGLVFTGWCPTC